MRLRLCAADRRHHLLTVALEIFSRQGYAGATTRQIAEQAGVTEAVIFRHFRSKEDLYWAVIDEQCRMQKGRDRLRSILDAGGDDAAIFAQLAEDILKRNAQDTSLSRLLLFSALENHKLSNRFFRTYISEYYETVAGRIRERIRQGKFRKVDPLLAARGFIGMVVYHFLIQELFGGKRYQKISHRRVSRTLAGIWLSGMVSWEQDKKMPIRGRRQMKVPKES